MISETGLPFQVEFLPVVTKDLVVEERVVLPPSSNPGVTVGRFVKSVLRLAVSPEYAHRPTALRLHSFLGDLAIPSHPLECRSIGSTRLFFVSLDIQFL